METANQQKSRYHKILLPVFIRYLRGFLSNGHSTLLLRLWESNFYVLKGHFKRNGYSGF